MLGILRKYLLLGVSIALLSACGEGGDSGESSSETCVHGGRVVDGQFQCNPNIKPDIQFSNAGIYSSEAQYSVIVSATDPDGDSVALSITQKPDWLSETRISSSEVKLAGSIPSQAAREVVITAEASDTELSNSNALNFFINMVSGYVQKGIMQNASVRIIGVNSIGQLDRDENNVVAGPVTYTAEDGGYIVGIHSEFNGSLIAMVRPRFKLETCIREEGCADIYGDIYENGSVDWPNPNGEVLTNIVCDSFGGCLAPSGAVNFGETYKPGNDFILLSAVNNFEHGQQVNVSSLTHIAAELANTVFQDDGSFSQGIYTKNTIRDANSLVANMFFESQVKGQEQVKGSDVDIVALRPADLRNVTGTLTTQNEVNAIHYALVSAAFERLTKENDPAAPALDTPVIVYLNSLVADYKGSRGLSGGGVSEYSVVQILTAVKAEMDELLASSQFVSGSYRLDLEAVVERNLTSIADFTNADIVAGAPAAIDLDGSFNGGTLSNAKLFVDKVMPWMGQVNLDFNGLNLSKFKLGCDNDSCIEWPELISGEFAGVNLSGFTSEAYQSVFDSHIAKGLAFDARARPELSLMLDKLNVLWILAVTCAHGDVNDLSCTNESFLNNYSDDINAKIATYKDAISPSVGTGLNVKKDASYALIESGAQVVDVITTLTFNDVVVDDVRLDLIVKISGDRGSNSAVFDVIYEGKIWYGDLLLGFSAPGVGGAADIAPSKVSLKYSAAGYVGSIVAEPRLIDFASVYFKANLVDGGSVVDAVAIADINFDDSVYLQANIKQALVAVESHLNPFSGLRYNVSSGFLAGKFVALNEFGQQENVFDLSLEYSASNAAYYYPDYEGVADKFPPLFNFFSAPDGLGLSSEWVDPDASKNRPLLSVLFDDESRAATGDSKWISTVTLTVPGVTDQYRLYESTSSSENHLLKVCRRIDDQDDFTCGAEGFLTDDMEVALFSVVKNEVNQVLSSGSADVDKLQKLMDYLRSNDITGSLLNKAVVTGAGLYKIDFPEGFLFLGHEVGGTNESSYGGVLEEVLTMGVDNIKVSFSSDLKTEGGMSHKPLFFDYNLKVPALDLDEGAATDDDADTDDLLYTASLVMGYDVSFYDPSISPIPAGGRSLFMAYSNIAADGITSLKPARGSLLLTVQDESVQRAEGLVLTTDSDDDTAHSSLNPVGYLTYKGELYGTARNESGLLVLRYTDGEPKILP